MTTRNYKIIELNRLFFSPSGSGAVRSSEPITRRDCKVHEPPTTGWLASRAKLIVEHWEFVSGYLSPKLEINEPLDRQGASCVEWAC